jgi:hypothetical protein
LHQPSLAGPRLRGQPRPTVRTLSGQRPASNPSIQELVPALCRTSPPQFTHNSPMLSAILAPASTNATAETSHLITPHHTSPHRLAPRPTDPTTTRHDTTRPHARLRTHLTLSSPALSRSLPLTSPSHLTLSPTSLMLTCRPTRSRARSLAYSLMRSFAHSLTPSRPHPLSRPLALSPSRPLALSCD